MTEKIQPAHFWAKKSDFRQITITRKDDYSILCTKIQLSILHRFLKISKDGQNRTSRKIFSVIFLVKRGPKSQNFKKSFFTSKYHNHMSSLCAKLSAKQPSRYLKLTVARKSMTKNVRFWGFFGIRRSKNQTIEKSFFHANNWSYKYLSYQISAF